MKKIIIYIFCQFIFCSVIKIDLITTNDMHGVIASQKANFMNPQYPPTILGGAAFSKYVDEIRMETNKNKEGLLILDGGNFFQGSPLGMADDGKTMIEWMNRIGYDAIVPGSYDFISGSENLNTLAKIANFPFLFSKFLILFFAGELIAHRNCSAVNQTFESLSIVCMNSSLGGNQRYILEVCKL